MFFVIILLLCFMLPSCAELRGIESALQGEIGKVAIYTYVPRGLVVSLDENLFFDGTNEKISRHGLSILNSIADVINSVDNICVVEGHTRDLDKFKSDIYQDNWELSLARANNIALYFVRCKKVNPKKLFPIGYGAFMPFHDNVSYTGDLNCRIDFVFLDYGKLGYD